MKSKVRVRVALFGNTEAPETLDIEAERWEVDIDNRVVSFFDEGGKCVYQLTSDYLVDIARVSEEAPPAVRQSRLMSEPSEHTNDAEDRGKSYGDEAGATR
jgi:hypothetical protein